jgi:uncharacterized protein (DUF362 family)
MTSGSFTSRRDFLKTSALGGVAVAAAWHLPAARAVETTSAAAGNFTSRVALTTGNDRADIAFRSLEPFKKEIAAAIGNKRVILKPNNVLIDRPLTASHADNLEGILEFLKTIGKKNVAIAESPSIGSALDGFANYGYNKFVDKYHVKLINLDSEAIEVVQILNQRDMHPHPCRVSSLLLDPNNFIISAAKLKTHDQVGATLSLKNIIVGSGIKEPGGGLDHGSDKPLLHGGGTYGINYNLFTLSARLRPDLAVIDGYEGMEGDGPVRGTPVEQRVCVASMDWLAADRVGVELMGIDFTKIGYLNYCMQAGDRGQGDLSKIAILGPPIKSVAKTYQLSPRWNQIVTWQKPMMAS